MLLVSHLVSEVLIVISSNPEPTSTRKMRQKDALLEKPGLLVVLSASPDFLLKHGFCNKAAKVMS